ncbi:Xaa-Pro aminopeptidase, partial [Vibrio parahaemolyticus AQ3810]
ETPTIPKWLANTLDENSAIAVDGRSISYAFYQELKQALEPKNIEIVLDLDLITPIWTDRPSRPSAEIFDHPVAFSGVETKQKLADIRKWLNENRIIDNHVLSAQKQCSFLVHQGHYRRVMFGYCPAALT